MEQLVQPFTIFIKHRGKEVSINIPATEKGIHIAIEDQGIEISTTPQEEPLQEATKTMVPLTRQGIINRLKENPILMSMYEAFGIPDTPKKTKRQLIAIGAYIESLLTEEEMKIYTGAPEEEVQEEEPPQEEEQTQPVEPTAVEEPPPPPKEEEKREPKTRKVSPVLLERKRKEKIEKKEEPVVKKPFNSLFEITM